MAVLNKNHKELINGVGKCSVPMWCGGMPAGFCDKDAYGVRPPCAGYLNQYTKEWHRNDGKYAGYVPDLACPMHGGPEKPN